MAGVLIHFLAGSPEVLDVNNDLYTLSYRKAYALGLILPDLAKLEIIKSEEDFNRFFEGCEKKDILTFEEFQKFKKVHHFNPMKQHPEMQDPADPNLEQFLRSDFVNMDKAVWKGVFCHLFFDKVYYYKDRCAKKLQAIDDWLESGHDEKDWYISEEWKKSSIAHDWYQGYDILNEYLEKNYGIAEKMSNILSASLFDEIKQGFHVSFIESTQPPKYINSDRVLRYISYAQLFARDVDHNNIQSVLNIFQPLQKDSSQPDQDIEDLVN